MAERIGILVADDHPIVREGIAGLVDHQPDMAVLDQVGDGLSAVEAFRRARPDVTLMDIQMPGLDGVEAIERIRRIDPAACIIVLTTYAGDSQALRALKAGASGYLLKNCIRKDLLQTIRNVHAGRRIVAPEVAEQIALHAHDERLTDRERRILLLVAEGKANKEIARRVAVSPDTVKADLKSIFVKLDVVDRTQAVVAAVRRGFIAL
ncbi:MAG: two component transcriptional regulator, LuxR family [Caulobacter sp.]|jgi:DNA-binding NarL/FixJ family response regulator|nr:two component transcriptional regulator, LuxR family [Caulobacter sp.]